MRIGIAQINTVAGAFDQTVERMVEQSRRAAEQEVELLVFPLAALTGIDVLPYADALPFMLDTTNALQQLSEQLACPAIVPVSVDFGSQEGYFEPVLLDGGSIRPLRMMAHLLGHEEQSPDAEPEVAEFEFGGLRFALALSYGDLDLLDDYDYDVDVALFLSGYSFAMDDPSSTMGADLAHTRYVADAQTMGSWLVGVGPIGGYGDQVFPGSSFVIAPSGEAVSVAPAFEEALLVADVGVAYDEHPALLSGADFFDISLHLWQALALGIHDYVSKQGLSEVALCLDGTLASAVLAALATDALGPTHVHVLVGSSAGSGAAACRALANRLRVNVEEGMGPTRGLDTRDLDELQLAALARAYGAVALSSLDKTALALEGELGRMSCATLCPLGDVYRSDVLDLAHMRNTISPLFRRVRLTEKDALALRMPDGSERGITDERGMMQVDAVLVGHIEYDRPLASLLEEGAIPDDLVEAVLAAQRLAEPARRAAPPVLAMSTRTLDDARFPLGVRWADTHRELPEGPTEQELADLLGSLPAPAAPAADAGAQVSPSEVDVPDLEGTLHMLRDLVEQGGFELRQVGMGRHGGTAEAAENGQEPSVRGPMPWTNPFSEN